MNTPEILAADFHPDDKATTHTELSPPSVKDAKYFFESGDCTFLVGGVLFKLHLFNLCRDPESYFCRMTADANGKPSEVIPLYDDLEDFRALCWLIYALPSETYALATNPGIIDVRKYLRIVELAHKYTLVDFERWAWTIARVNAQAISSYLASSGCPQEDLAHLLALGLSCPDSTPELVGLVETAWIDRIRAGQVSHSYALTVGEELGRTTFQGDIYLDLRRKITSGETLAFPGIGFAKLGLTSTQLKRLLMGHALLTAVFASGAKACSCNVYNSGMGYYQYCSQIWSNMPSSYCSQFEQMVRSAPCIQRRIDQFCARAMSSAPAPVNPVTVVPASGKKNLKGKKGKKSTPASSSNVDNPSGSGSISTVPSISLAEFFLGPLQLLADGDDSDWE